MALHPVGSESWGVSSTRDRTDVAWGQVAHLLGMTMVAPSSRFGVRDSRHVMLLMLGVCCSGWLCCGRGRGAGVWTIAEERWGVVCVSMQLEGNGSGEGVSSLRNGGIRIGGGVGLCSEGGTWGECYP